jgi:hypothetical protein
VSATAGDSAVASAAAGSAAAAAVVALAAAAVVPLAGTAVVPLAAAVVAALAGAASDCSPCPVRTAFSTQQSYRRAARLARTWRGNRPGGVLAD